MPLRPFPLPLSIGTDIASINRVRKILDRGHDSFRSYIRRFLTEQEQKQILRKYANADLSNEPTVGVLSHLLAGRWAAKEATIKAVTWRKLSFHDIIIRNPPYAKRGYVHAVILDPIPPSGNETKANARAPNIESGRGATDHRSSSAGEKTDTTSSDSREVASEGTLGVLSGSKSYQQGFNPESTSATQGNTEHTMYVPDDDSIDDLSGQIAQISISHDRGYATAVCLAAQEPGPGDVGGELAARNL